jgi:glycosyltransferase involved in cell wall biosynthesis
MRAFSELAGKHPRTCLLLVGDGPERDNLQHLASELGVSDKVIFTGRIPYTNMPAYVRLMDVATAPYQLNGDFYFSPLKLMEYLACGIPVVASAGGEIKRLIRSGQNGLLISKSEPYALFNSLSRIYSDAKLRAKIGEGSGSLIAGRSWEDNARKTIDFMQTRMEARGKNGG